ncbi:MAG: dephospho-CoA kinase [Caulobacteraceae bacterium]|nr:dephospho-CoA kinase [Caulobacteraceae bacterium]
MILIGLTGSVGMGKSTTAAMFAELGAPVWDADAAVHRLYARGGAAVGPVGDAFPGVVADGAVDRAALGARVHGDPVAFERLEALVHPLVAADRQAFLARAEAEGHVAAVLDIPLLFETGAEDKVDAVVVVTAPAQVQRERVLARPGWDETRLAALLERQTPDEHKRARADYVIDTSLGRESARARVKTVLEEIHSPAFRSRRRALD